MCKIEADSDADVGVYASVAMGGGEDSLNLLQEYIISLKLSHSSHSGSSGSKSATTANTNTNTDTSNNTKEDNSPSNSNQSTSTTPSSSGYRDWVCYNADTGNPNKSDNVDMNDEGYIAPYSSYACGGMVRATIWLLKEVGSSLISLYKSGYNIKLVGHSLGGGVASILTYLLSRILPMLSASVPGVRPGIRPGGLQCITYGCPSCLEEKLSHSLRPYVTTVVLHDDVISRVTPNSIRSLMKELMIFRSGIFHHIQQDWEDVIVRASSLWSPQYRDNRPTATTATTSNTNTVGEISPNTSNPNTANTVHTSSSDTEDPLPQFNSTLLESHVSSTNPTQHTASILHNMVSVDEEVLLDLYLPGDVVHIYSIYGQYRVKHVPLRFNSLRSILVQGNMFRDHRSMTIYEALLEVKAVRRCTQSPPAWVPYNASQSCQCCHSRFTWHTTFRGDAQQYKERYNCRCCGGLVCGPCSDHKENSLALSSIGLILPNNRICDRCFYSGKMQ